LLAAAFLGIMPSRAKIVAAVKERLKARAAVNERASRRQ
jgi:hypothetical protein